LRAQPGQQGRQQEGRNGRDHAEPELARERLARGAHHVGQLLGLAQYPPRLGGDSKAQRREAHDPPGALDQGDSDHRLELLDPGRQGRLGNETGLGRAAEMAVGFERHEILKLLQRGEVDAHSGDPRVGPASPPGDRVARVHMLIASLDQNERFKLLGR